jgi:hypothetical protein
VATRRADSRVTTAQFHREVVSLATLPMPVMLVAFPLVPKMRLTKALMMARNTLEDQGTQAARQLYRQRTVQVLLIRCARFGGESLALASEAARCCPRVSR